MYNIIYYHNGMLGVKTKATLQEAKDWINYEDSEIQNAQILVDYNLVEVYKSKFEDLYTTMKELAFGKKINKIWKVNGKYDII